MAKVPTILVAEDEENDYLLLQRAFSRQEFQVSLRRAWDGVQAIDYIEGVNGFGDRSEFPFPDLLVLDLKMPCKDGFDVLQWVRKHPRFKTMIVVVLTSSDQPGDISRAYALGTNSFLTKPSDFKDLAELARVLANYWLRWTHRPVLSRNEPARESRSEEVA